VYTALSRKRHEEIFTYITHSASRYALFRQKIQRLIKDSKLKVQAAIQDKHVRVSGKGKDQLQEAIALVRAAKFDLPLQFTNFRD